MHDFVSGFVCAAILIVVLGACYMPYLLGVLGYI